MIEDEYFTVDLEERSESGTPSGALIVFKDGIIALDTESMIKAERTKSFLVTKKSCNVYEWLEVNLKNKN